RSGRRDRVHPEGGRSYGGWSDARRRPRPRRASCGRRRPPDTGSGLVLRGAGRRPDPYLGLVPVSTDSALLVVYLAAGLLIGLVAHEYAHAWVATRLGDHTPRLQGRLTLNPKPHI